METLTLDLPAMYGDHHVIEVRRILLALPGVEAVNASSCFHTVEISYQPAHIDADAITTRLNEAGYLGALTLPLESGVAASLSTEQPTYFRHTAAYPQTGRVISFAQAVSDTWHPLWPCPGMGTTARTEGEEDVEGNA